MPRTWAGEVGAGLGTNAQRLRSLSSWFDEPLPLDTISGAGNNYPLAKIGAYPDLISGINIPTVGMFFVSFSVFCVSFFFF